MASVDGTMGSTNETIGSRNHATCNNHDTLYENDELLPEATVSLDRIEQAPVEGDSDASRLDAVQAELGRQTGVQDRLFEILGAIDESLRAPCEMGRRRPAEQAWTGSRREV